MKPWVVMRAHNDMPLVEETLAGLRAQSIPHRLLALDNASKDGTREALARQADRVIDVPAGAYVPGRVLNQAMRLTDGPITVFLNSDCTPLHHDWLQILLTGFEGEAGDDERVIAVFGQQLPRSDAHPLHAKDTLDAFGDGVRQGDWRHCFSMAASAIRREEWERYPFDEALQFSEDIDWTWSARQRGRLIRYVPDAVAIHSHNYSLRQLARRHFGEGRAEARIFDWSTWQRSLLRYTVLPLGRQVLDDLRWALDRGAPRIALASPAARVAQALGRRAGFLMGLRDGPRRPGEGIP
jgi:rhamnosyltransferase